MFKNPPRIFAHKTVVEKGNFVLPDYILNKGTDSVNLFHRFCPHRMYPLHQPGDHIENIYCKFHAFEWAKDGTPLNNNKKITCGNTNTGRSGLVFKNFVEPRHSWVTDLENETELVYSHSIQGESKGSWLWLMDAEADLLHIHKNGIHPILANLVDLKDVITEEGDGWVIQHQRWGFWLYIWPFTFIEYGRPGRLMINSIIPDSAESEYGFKWMSQYYYDPCIDENTRLEFQLIDSVFDEDLATAELQKGDYFPLMKASNRYEDHCVHFGKWILENKVK
jgi:hypothetical protein